MDIKQCSSDHLWSLGSLIKIPVLGSALDPLLQVIRERSLGISILNSGSLELFCPVKTESFSLMVVPNESLMKKPRRKENDFTYT